MQQNKELQEKILSNLEKLPASDLDALKNLFSDNLSYDIESGSIPTRNWREPVKEKIEKVIFRASHGDFKVIWAKLKSDRLSRGDERPIINSINKEYPYNLIVFSNSDDTRWDFVNVKLVVGEESEDNKLPERQRIVRRISVTEPYGLRRRRSVWPGLRRDRADLPLGRHQRRDH